MKTPPRQPNPNAAWNPNTDLTLLPSSEWEAERRRRHMHNIANVLDNRQRRGRPMRRSAATRTAGYESNQQRFDAYSEQIRGLRSTITHDVQSIQRQREIVRTGYTVVDNRRLRVDPEALALIPAGMEYRQARINRNKQKIAEALRKRKREAWDPHQDLPKGPPPPPPPGSGGGVGVGIGPWPSTLKRFRFA